jgi:hypothetical protein
MDDTFLHGGFKPVNASKIKSALAVRRLIAGHALYTGQEPKTALDPFAVVIERKIDTVDGKKRRMG